MTTETHHTPSIVQDVAAVRCKDAPRVGTSQAVVTTLGAARLRMANERTSSCLGTNDYPPEAPSLAVVMLLVACASCVLFVAVALRIFGM